MRRFGFRHNDRIEPDAVYRAAHAFVMSARTKKLLLCLIYAATIAAIVDICVVSPRRSGLIIAMDWPSDPHALARGILHGAILLGASLFFLLFASTYSGRQKTLAVAASLLTLGSLLGRTFPILGELGWTLSGILSLVAILSFVGMSIFRHKGDPVVPAVALSVSLLPYAIGLSDFYPLLWYLPLVATGAALGWATAQVLTLSRSKAAISLVVGIALGAMVIPIQLGTFRKSWYGYHISLDCLQFGNINGDNNIDLMTHGYYGMVAGNFYWFTGHGDSFDDWRNSHSIDRLGQICGRLLDIDADGDADIVCSMGIYLNSTGAFHQAYAPTFTSRDESNAEQMFFEGLWECHGPVDVDVFGADLTGDGQMELLSIPKHWRWHGGRNLIIGLRPKDTEWAFSMFHVEPGAGIENPTGTQSTLVLPQHTSGPLVRFLNDYHIRHRITAAPIPDAPAEAETVEYQWLDFDGDKKSELAICSELETGQSEQIKHFGGSGGYSPTVCRVEVYKETEGGFHLAESVETKPYICSRNNTPMPIQQFGDIDKDGLRDFIGQDGYVYLLKQDWSFEQDGLVDLKNEDCMARLYLHDLNGDGVLDVISSFQPFWNIRLGPLTQ